MPFYSSASRNEPKNRLLRSITLACILAILVGCQTSNSPASPAATTPIRQEDAEVHLPPETPAGRLAYIGGDGNVYVTAVNDPAPLQLTGDATTAAEGPGLSYHRLSWSPDGRLAFAAVTRLSINQASSELYMVEQPGQPAQLIGRSDSHFVIYIYWAPVPCPGRPACRRLAYLIEDDEDISLRLVELEAGQVKNRRVGLGRPFYFSWAPDGRRMVWHIGGARRHNDQARIALHDVEQDQTEILPYPPGLFMAPAWSPQGRRWLGVSADEKFDQLQTFEANQPATLTSVLDNHFVFAWSPAGDQVAYAIRKSNDDPVYGPIHLFDLRTQQSRQLTDTPFRIVAFFWGPDGQRIGYLKQVTPDDVWLQWRMYDLVQDRDRGFEAFFPSFHMRFMVGSFNQYAQSDRFWSPDSRYLVYADRDPKLVERVWLIDTWAERGAEPILVDEGSIGIWSWN